MSKSLSIAWLVLAMVLCLPGCFHTQLNGSVGGAEVVVAELGNPNKVVFQGTTSSKDSLDSRPLWSSWSAFTQMALQGVFVIDAETDGSDIDPDTLYLVTASGGVDADVDLNRKRDKQPTAVAGEWHAIMTGAQLLTIDRKISVLTEAVYQSVVADLDGLTDEQLMTRLDKAAAKVIGDENRDGSVDYLDVLQWNRLNDRGRLRADQGELDRLSLAIREGQEQATLKSLGNRVLDGPAGVDQDDLDVVKVLGDGSCEGRSRTVQVGEGENTTTVPPSSACGSDDTGSVESTQDTTTAVAIPASNGLIRVLKAKGISLEDLLYDQADGEISFTVKESGKEPRQLTLAVESAAQLDKMTNVYQRILAAVDSNSAPGQSLATTPYRRVYTGGAGDVATSGAVSVAAADLEAAFADVLSYGALASNWSACFAYRYFSIEQAAGRSVPEEALGWAVKVCTSQLVEVEAYVAESTPAELQTFEETALEVELEGCSDCYSDIVIPATDQLVVAGADVRFEGIAPQSARQVRWAFGDGTVDDGLSAVHRYNSPGQYSAELRVEYSDGTSDINKVEITVERPTNKCLRPPEVDAGQDQEVDASSVVVLSGQAETFVEPGCTAVGLNWQQIGSGPTVTLSGSEKATATFTAPAVDEETTLNFQLTVEDSDGGQGADTLAITVKPRNACSREPVVSASYQYLESLGAYALEFNAEAFGPSCDIVGDEWQQLLGSGDPVVTLLDDTLSGTVFFADDLGIEVTTELTFRVTVSDTDGHTTSDTVLVPVQPVIGAPGCDQPPTVNPAAVISPEGDAYGLLSFATAKGPDCAIVSQEWQQISGKPEVELVSEGDIVGFTIPEVSEATTLVFRVTVSDTEGQTATGTVDVALSPEVSGAPPTLKVIISWTGDVNLDVKVVAPNGQTAPNTSSQTSRTGPDELILDSSKQSLLPGYSPVKVGVLTPPDVCGEYSEKYYCAADSNGTLTVILNEGQAAEQTYSYPFSFTYGDDDQVTLMQVDILASKVAPP